MLRINVGEEISFLYNESIVARVLDRKNSVEFQGEGYSVTGLARKLLAEQRGWRANGHMDGWKYFTKDGVVLNDLRDSIESAEFEDE